MGDVSFQKERVNVQDYINSRDMEMMNEGWNQTKYNIFRDNSHQSEQNLVRNRNGSSELKTNNSNMSPFMNRTGVDMNR